MTDYFAPAPRGWGYAAFIDELKPLIQQAQAFGSNDRAHDSEVFRAWRHRVSTLCTRISRSHVDSNSGLDHRYFGARSYGSVSRIDRAGLFQRDLKDTLFELQHIVEQYEKFGEPKTRAGHAPKPAPVEETSPAAKPVEPEWPQEEKLTLYWLLKNLPLSAWAIVGAVWVAAFGAGTTIGAWPSVQKWLEPPAKAAKP